MAVQAKDQFDIPMHEIVGSDIKRLDPTKEGIKIWNAYNDYRAKLVELTGSYKEGERKYSVKTKPINKFSTNADLDKQVRAMITGGGNKVNKEDVEMLVGIYEELTKQEVADHHEQKDIHWMGRTFDHAPLVGAIASLSSLQNEVLSARAKAIGLLKSKVSTGQYSFNKIMGLAYPETSVLNPGDEFEMTVMMAAFDSDKQPQVKPGQGSVVRTENGQAIVKLRAPQSGDMNITGQVGIADKSGNVVWKDYTAKVQVAPKGGSLEMPEFNILYRGYGNKIIASASGVVSTNISAPGCSVTPTTINGRKGFAVKPGPGARDVNISLTGKDAKGKTVSFGSTKYSVKSFPKPALTTRSISKGGGRVQVALENSPINATFTIKTISVGDDYSGAGSIVPSSALAKTKVGKNVSVVVSAVNSLTGEIVDVTGALKVTN
jgi:gliding motility-associated protein GldM